MANPRNCPAPVSLSQRSTRFAMPQRAVLALMALLLSAGTSSGEESGDSAIGPTYSDEVEAVYRTRYERVYGDPPPGTVQGFFQRSPLEDVPGAKHFQPFPTRSSPTISLSALDAAEQYAAERNSTALIIWRGGYVEREVYFEGLSGTTPLESGSMAKPLGVLAVGRAVTQGAIPSLDTAAAEYFGEWKNTPKENILVRHLLGMTSGFQPTSFEPGPDSVMARALLHPYHNEIMIREYPLVHEPGSRYDYVNVNAELLAPLIERSTQSRYATWLSRELLQPLGAQGGKVWLNREGGVAHAGGGAQLPADTYLRLAIVVMRGGQWNGQALIATDFIEGMKSPTPQNPHAGMGLYLGYPYAQWRGPLNPDQTMGRIYHSEPYAADDLMLFDGNGNQVAYMVPSEDLVILRLGRWPSPEKRWDHSFLPNTVLRGIIAPFDR